MNQPFDDNVYLINLSHVKTPAEIIYDLSTVLDSEEARNKRVCLKLGEIELNQSQILSIKSLINSINSTLSFLDTTSPLTESAALALGIVIANSSKPVIEAPEPEMTYKTIDEVIMEKEELESADVQEDEPVVENQFTEPAPAETEAQESVLPEEYNQEDQETEEVQIPSTPREYEKMEESYLSEEEKEEQSVENSDENAIGENISLNIPSNEEIKEELDTIFNTEKKLEEIFATANNNQEDELKDHYTSIVNEEKIYTDEDFELDSYPTKYIKQTIRSGQVINYEGNIVIIGDCHPGSEITAAGDITVWGVLSGIAHAGSNGNEKAKIRALKMNAIQLRVANCYARRPDALNTIFTEKTNTFIPEEARIINGEIVIFKIND